ncbi:MAG TPA: ABC transporter permease [Acidobacteriaceae bacterium]|jgi:predicted permease|nr:ABC transporter permease [Acidobacteriaceae bacterium]
MDWLKELGRRIEMLLHRRQFSADLDEEMQLHLELRKQEQMERGMAPNKAHSTARRRFGNVTGIKEKSHMSWGWDWFEQLMQDVSYGVRGMLRSPGLTIVALLSLALGIGANTAIFSLMDAVMLRSLPVKDPGQLVLLGDGSEIGITDDFPNTALYSYPFYRQMQKKNAVFSDVAAVFSMRSDLHGSVEGHSETEPMAVQLVSGSYFPVLGVHAMMGRTLTEEDDQTKDGSPVAVVSYTWWTRSLARDPDVLHKKLRIGSTLFTIVGVAPAEFFGTKVGESPDIWIPLSMQKEIPPYFDAYSDNFGETLDVIGRLKPDVNMAQATANVNLLYQQILRGFPNAHMDQKSLEALKNTHVALTPMAKGLSDLRGQYSEPLKILMGVVGLVLLIACANIANLLLARSTARAREFAVRQALGARRSRLIRQLLTESLTLALAGGALGVAFAVGATHFLLRMISGGTETVPLDVSINIRLLLFTLGITLITALLFGTIPALRATQLDLTESLKDGRGPASGATKSPLARALVISQVAFSLVLLVGAGLFLRTLINLDNVNTGFNKENVLRLQTDTSSIGYKDDDPRMTQLYQQIEDRVRALPGVRAASYSSFTFDEGSWSGSIWVEGFNNNKDVNVPHNVVGADYFATMGIPLLAGRTFGPQDFGTNSPKVAVISETMARTMFPKGSAIGSHYGMDGPKHSGDVEVIGIVKDTKFQHLDEAPTTLDYLPYTEHPMYLEDFEVRYTGDFSAISSAVQTAIHGVSPNLQISDVTTLEEQVGRSITSQRLVAQLSTFFGLLAVFLSCIGIYGLMSYVVSRRTNEIGIRMALGAGRSNVRWLVMREILQLVAVGVAIGIPVALAGGHWIANMLYGLKATDPMSLAVAVVAMLLVAVVAGYLPARRASRVEPMVALRCQ